MKECTSVGVGVGDVCPYGPAHLMIIQLFFSAKRRENEEANWRRDDIAIGKNKVSKGIFSLELTHNHERQGGAEP